MNVRTTQHVNHAIENRFSKFQLKEKNEMKKRTKTFRRSGSHERECPIQWSSLRRNELVIRRLFDEGENAEWRSKRRCEGGTPGEERRSTTNFIDADQMHGRCALIQFEIIRIENSKFDPTKNARRDNGKTKHRTESNVVQGWRIYRRHL